MHILELWFGNVLEIIWRCFGHVLETFRTCFGQVLGTSWQNVGNELGMCRAFAYCIFAVGSQEAQCSKSHSILCIYVFEVPSRCALAAFVR